MSPSAASNTIFRQCGTIFDRTQLAKKVDDLQQASQNPDIWDTPEKAQQVMKSLKGKETLLKALQKTLRDFEDYQLLQEEVKDAELQPLVEDLLKRLEDQKIALFLSGKYDDGDAIVSLYSGAGGKDAQDFTEMLLRMVTRFCEQQEWSVTVLDRQDGEEVGVKSIVLQVEGHMAYGLLQSEHGVHRLVRQSPFNSGNTRETSFAKIDVIPLIEENLSVDIPPDDLKIDVYRSSGKGGQSVNTTDSAVRISHIPTGIVVQCQNERSQLQNKQTALKMLMSKLEQMREEAHVEKIQDLKGSQKEVAWGNQIRSYVLHPYQMVKDHRTSEETSQVQAVLDGDLMPFMKAYLHQKSMPTSA